METASALEQAEARPDRPSRTLNDWIAATTSVPEASRSLRVFHLHHFNHPIIIFIIHVHIPFALEKHQTNINKNLELTLTC